MIATWQQSCHVQEEEGEVSHNMSAKVGGESIHVDPMLLFQHLLQVAGNVSENIEEIFKFELCSHPSSLFNLNGLQGSRANKPLLAGATSWNMR